jgi:predicted kinase/diadenosine tetraphosphatase ApaH/serine/threonine PP2A family protein phosphatase/8-oxo-dGTP pyrophosphatase MutT (NUDIX family)
MRISIPKLSLVLLVGPSGSGKSTFARRHFLPTEIVSSDACRGIVSDDENNQEATDDAFDLLKTIVRTRLRRGLLTVIDATNVQDRARASLIAIAKEYHVQSTAIVFDLPERVCQERNALRPDRQFGPHVVRNHIKEMRRGFFRMQKEFRWISVLRSVEEVEAAEIERTPLWTDRREVTGPFDIVGDVHGCIDELRELIGKLGYVTSDEGVITPPEGRTLMFVGDLIDRGPSSVGVLRLVMDMVEAGTAICVPGNHDVKLLKHLQGKRVGLTYGLQGTVDELEGESEEFRQRVMRFLDGLISHFVLDGGRLVVAHAGLKEEMHGRASGRVREFCLYGDTTGETDEFGLPVRYPWATDYRGRAMVVYGHTPIPQPEWLNGTINIDTGCAFGGRLSALRYPEREIVSVPARKVYAASKRPFLAGETVEFGERLPDVEYVPRPSAYAVIRNDAGRVAVVQTATGAYLPGGGLIDNETPEYGMLREIQEEAGLAVNVKSRIGEATEYVAGGEEGFIAKQGTFYLAQYVGDSGAGAHALEWLSPQEAMGAIRHASHGWAIQQAFGGLNLSAQHVIDDVLDLDDVTGKRLVDTRLRGKVTVREENAAAALEIMSRFAANPKWLIYLPPTMSPSETADEEGYLEYPTQAFQFFRDQGIETVVCQEKHMGSRAVVVLCRDEAAARRRFGVEGEGRGIVLTRTGRRFFENRELEAQLLDRLDEGITEAGLWEELRTDWMLLDTELMPWSQKAQELLRRQYAPVGVAAQTSTAAAVALLGRTSVEGLEGLLGRMADRQRMANDYVAAYARYCWPVESVEDLRLAPFHLLATEGAAHVDKPHTWHMETLGRFCGEGVLYRTPNRVVRLDDDRAVAEATAWWEERTNAGGEGMVIKPLDFIAQNARGLVQPALKCRGREYLRIIYGPEYTRGENLERLRKRGLSTKRSMAIREFALGVEGIERFVNFEPLRRVHECVFGVLALESEPVDPRL